MNTVLIIVNIVVFLIFHFCIISNAEKTCFIFEKSLYWFRNRACVWVYHSSDLRYGF